MSLSYIRQMYAVPAYIGRRIKYTDGVGSEFYCTIKSAKNQYLSVVINGRIKGDGDRMILHPTWNIDYLDGD